MNKKLLISVIGWGLLFTACSEQQTAGTVETENVVQADIPDSLRNAQSLKYQLSIWESPSELMESSVEVDSTVEFVVPKGAQFLFSVEDQDNEGLFWFFGDDSDISLPPIELRSPESIQVRLSQVVLDDGASLGIVGTSVLSLIDQDVVWLDGVYPLEDYPFYVKLASGEVLSEGFETEIVVSSWE